MRKSIYLITQNISKLLELQNFDINLEFIFLESKIIFFLISTNSIPNDSSKILSICITKLVTLKKLSINLW